MQIFNIFILKEGIEMKFKSVVLIICLSYLAGTGLGQAEEGISPAKESANAQESVSPAKESANAQESVSPQKEEAKTRSQQGVSQAKAIVWLSYEEGLARGKNEKKKIFLNFYADWCQYCKVMDTQTFRDSSVIKYLNENFIPVRVNSDHKPQIAAAYNVTGLPVSWFIAENGESIGSQPGFLAPDTLLPLLKYIYTDSYKKMNFMQFMEKM